MNYEKKCTFVVMERTLSILLAAATAFSIAGCQKTIQPTPKEKEITTFERLRDVGKEIPNPKITFGDCIPEGSEATLKSIRYVEGKPIYYMDYTAKVDWESLLTDPEHQTPLFGVKEVTNKVSKALFRGFEPKAPIKGAKGSCSGFICKNSKGEILNGRNFDGDYGEMVVVFNHNVKPGEHKSVMMTDLNSAQKFSGIGGYAGEKILLESGKELNVLLRQPISTVDGMNDAGLVIAGYQLPDFKDDNVPHTADQFECKTPRPEGTYQNTGKPQIGFVGLFNLALTKCATVDDVIELLKSYDYVSLISDLNMHWCVSDSKKWVTLEYWKNENGKDSLYVFDEEARNYAAQISGHEVAYEYLSMENYYYNLVPAVTWFSDPWQRELGAVIRVHNMMAHYSLVMDEEEALRVLQYGNYGIEVSGQVTNWSCVYNSAQRTVHFTVRNQTDRAFTIDLKKDL